MARRRPPRRGWKGAMPARMGHAKPKLSSNAMHQLSDSEYEENINITMSLFLSLIRYTHRQMNTRATTTNLRYPLIQRRWIQTADPTIQESTRQMQRATPRRLKNSTSCHLKDDSRPRHQNAFFFREGGGTIRKMQEPARYTSG